MPGGYVLLAEVLAEGKQMRSTPFVMNTAHGTRTRVLAVQRPPAQPRIISDGNGLRMGTRRARRTGGCTVGGSPVLRYRQTLCACSLSALSPKIRAQR